MKKLSFLFAALSIMLISNLQAANVQLTVKLKNGDVVTGKTTLPKISVVTAYGTLTIPIEKVSNLRLGIVSDHTKDGAVLPDLSKLQTLTNEAEAKVVYERLLAYGSPNLHTC